MKVLICGDRNWTDYDAVETMLGVIHMAWVTDCGEFQPSKHSRKSVTLVIEGGASGADECGRLAAQEFDIPVKTVKAEWTEYGKAAGPIRNKAMLKEKPDLVLAFHSDITKSKGTKDMLNQAKKAKIRTILVS